MTDLATVTSDSWTEPDKNFRATFGMWVFLATEVLFFGGIFLAYAVVRSQNVAAFDAAGRHASFLFGTVNTYILVTSSFAATIAIFADERDDISLVRGMVAVTAALGVLFLIVKGLEYRQDIMEHLIPGPAFPANMPAAEAFFSFYWVMTGLHAVHLSIGIGLMTHVWRLARRARRPGNFRRTLEVCVLYWHLVDAIWVMLYAIFYLVGRSG